MKLQAQNGQCQNIGFKTKTSKRPNEWVPAFALLYRRCGIVGKKNSSQREKKITVPNPIVGGCTDSCDYVHMDGGEKTHSPSDVSVEHNRLIDREDRSNPGTTDPIRSPAKNVMGVRMEEVHRIE